MEKKNKRSNLRAFFWGGWGGLVRGLREEKKRAAVQN